MSNSRIQWLWGKNGPTEEERATAEYVARYVTPLGDRRERDVPCSRCQQPTWALSATCDNCWNVEKEADA
jgi:hypothetical protein